MVMLDGLEAALKSLEKSMDAGLDHGWALGAEVPVARAEEVWRCRSFLFNPP
jgi:hypothetical protein